MLTDIVVNDYTIKYPSLFVNNVSNSSIHKGFYKTTPYIFKIHNRYDLFTNETKIHEHLKQNKYYSKYCIQLVDTIIYEHENKSKYILVFEQGLFDLFDYIYKDLDLISRLSLCVQIIDSVKFIHSQNVLHLDIKPENVMLIVVDGKKYAKLIDFEMSQIADETGHAATHILGSKNFLDPVIKRSLFKYNSAVYTRETDIYALSVLLFEISSKSRFDVPFVFPEDYIIGDGIDSLIKDRKNIDPRIVIILDKCITFNEYNRIKIEEMREQFYNIYFDEKNKI